MNGKAIRKYIILVAMLLLIPLSFILFFNGMQHHFDALDYYGNYELVENDQGAIDTLWSPIEHLTLIDEQGQPFSTKELEGDVWLACFYSTSSPQIAKITERLLSVNFKFRTEEDIKIVAISDKPQFDTPERRQSYLDELGSSSDKWRFLSGSTPEVQKWASEQFSIEEPGKEAIVWLVDDSGHLRGKFNANLEKEISKVIGAIAMMKKEIDLREYEKQKMEK